MAWHLSLKEKVVLSVLLRMLLDSCVLSAQSDLTDHANTRITLSCQNIRLEEALQRLSLKAGVFFIYSSNWLEADRLVSLKAVHQPLHEVLNAIGSSLQLTFRYEGKYVLVKKNETTARSLQRKKIPQQPRQHIEQELAIASADLSESLPLPVFRKTSLKIPAYTAITTPAQPLFQYQKPILDTMALLSVIQPKDQIQKNWFITGGLLFSDFIYGGLEFRAGYKFAYAVFNTSITKEGFYRAGYGAGIRLPSSSKKLSYNVIYTYAQLKAAKSTVVHQHPNHTLVESGYKLFVRHNQIRIAIQYNLTPRIDVHAGTSLNLTHTYYQPRLLAANTVATRVKVLQRNNAAENAVYTTSEKYYPASVTIASPASAPAVHHTPNTWLGWELGIFYRFQF